MEKKKKIIEENKRITIVIIINWHCDENLTLHRLRVCTDAFLVFAMSKGSENSSSYEFSPPPPWPMAASTSSSCFGTLPGNESSFPIVIRTPLLHLKRDGTAASTEPLREEQWHRLTIMEKTKTIQKKKWRQEGRVATSIVSKSHQNTSVFLLRDTTNADK